MNFLNEYMFGFYCMKYIVIVLCISSSSLYCLLMLVCRWRVSYAGRRIECLNCVFVEFNIVVNRFQCVVPKACIYLGT